MNTQQKPLFNYQQLTSTKAMKALHRARRASTLASTPSPSPIAPASTAKSPAPPAAAKPSPSKDCSRRWKEDDAEFGLPDEDRVLTVLHRFSFCPICGCKPSLARRDGKYQVSCKPMGSFHIGKIHKSCKETPWFKSSTEAVQYWRVIAALEK